MTSHLAAVTKVWKNPLQTLKRTTSRSQRLSPFRVFQDRPPSIPRFVTELCPNRTTALTNLLAAHPTVANLSPNGREAEGMGGTHAGGMTSDIVLVPGDTGNLGVSSAPWVRTMPT